MLKMSSNLFIHTTVKIIIGTKSQNISSTAKEKRFVFWPKTLRMFTCAILMVQKPQIKFSLKCFSFSLMVSRKED